MKRSNVDQCSIDQWLSIEPLRKLTFPTEVLPVPEEFVSYLLDDGGIFMSEDRFPVVKQTDPDYDEDPDQLERWTKKRRTRDHTETESDDEDESDRPDPLSHPSITLFEQRIKTVITDLGGSVFPKLNWSSPKDAVWMTAEGTLLCTNPSEIFLLFKSSDFIQHDLTEAYSTCEDFELSSLSSSSTPTSYDSAPTSSSSSSSSRPKKVVLALRMWTTINPSMEFRCFVKNNQLIAISQRDYTNYYSFVHESHQDILLRISNFFLEKIKGVFPETDFVVDIYLTKRRIFIVDFNPFNPVTDALLYDWSEILSIPSSSSSSSSSTVDRLSDRLSTELRLTPKEGQRRGNTNQFGLPTDLVDVSSTDAINAFAKLIRQGVVPR